MTLTTHTIRSRCLTGRLTWYQLIVHSCRFVSHSHGEITFQPLETLEKVHSLEIFSCQSRIQSVRPPTYNFWVRCSVEEVLKVHSLDILIFAVPPGRIQWHFAFLKKAFRCSSLTPWWDASHVTTTIDISSPKHFHFDLGELFQEWHFVFFSNNSFNNDIGRGLACPLHKLLPIKIPTWRLWSKMQDNSTDTCVSLQMLQMPLQILQIPL